MLLLLLLFLKRTLCRHGSDNTNSSHPAATGGVGAGATDGRTGSARTGGVGGVGSLSRGALMTLSVVSILSVVYSACPTEPRVRIVLILPPASRLGKHSQYFLFSELSYESTNNIYEQDPDHAGAAAGAGV